MQQLTEQQAIAIGESKIYDNWDYNKKAGFQLFQDKLCMPFSAFHEAVEKVLKRPVFTHEFGFNYEGLIEEYLKYNIEPSIEHFQDVRILLNI